MGKRHCIGKVLVDATQDKSEDQYSEGDVEDELLAIVRKGRREEALRQDTRWPVLYHLSEERQNIVSWLPLEKTDRVLDKMTTEMIRAKGRESLGIKGFSAGQRESREVAA